MFSLRQNSAPVNDADPLLLDLFYPAGWGDLCFPRGLARELAVSYMGGLLRAGWRCSPYPLGFTDPYTGRFESVVSDFVLSGLEAHLSLWAMSQRSKGLSGFGPLYPDRHPRYTADRHVVGLIRHALIRELQYLTWATSR